MLTFFVYILASYRNGTLYIGVTNSLARRINEHKNGTVEGFTKRYKIHTIVYFEEYEEAMEAVQREKQLKGWIRKKKIDLIESRNPMWADLWNEVSETSK